LGASIKRSPSSKAPPLPKVITLNKEGIKEMMKLYEKDDAASNLALKKLLKRAKVSKASAFYKDFFEEKLAGGNSPARSGSPAGENVATKTLRIGSEKGIANFAGVYGAAKGGNRNSKLSINAVLAELAPLKGKFSLADKIVKKLLGI
jgi:hypothetical protein